MMPLKDDDGIERSRKKKKLLDDLRSRRRYWELKEEVDGRKIWNFIPKKKFNLVL